MIQVLISTVNAYLSIPLKKYKTELHACGPAEIKKKYKSMNFSQRVEMGRGVQRSTNTVFDLG